ncbi:MAG TPA: hypothetical protein VII56_14795 [Rhizomicrobium sp.]
MTIDVVDNHDGTFKVSCGGESKTVGHRNHPNPPVRKSTAISLLAATEKRKSKYFPDKIPPNPGGEAARARSPFVMFHINAGSTGELEHLLKTEIMPNIGGNAPVGMSVNWRGAERPDTEKITQLVMAAEMPPLSAFHLYTGSST